MTKEDTTKLLMIIQAAYPNYKVEDKSVAINTWYMMLGEYDYQLVLEALEIYIANDTSGFAPSIGQVIDKINKLTVPEQMVGSEAWALVSRALKRSGYNAQEEFDALPPTIQRAVGSAHQLHEWALMDQDVTESVIHSNFLKSYDTIVEREKETSKIPFNVRRLITETSDKLKIEG